MNVTLRGRRSHSFVEDAAAQGIGEPIPNHTVAPWRQHFGGGSLRRLNKPAVYDHTGRKALHQKNSSNESMEREKSVTPLNPISRQALGYAE